MTRKGALKAMRRLFPSIAGREVFARLVNGKPTVGITVTSGSQGRWSRELIKQWPASSYADAVAKAMREV